MTRYLNYNSTYYSDKSNKFNPSDIYYQDNIDLSLSSELIKNYLKEYVNASDNAKVIFNSGATESIANMFLWAKEISKFGVVLGSTLDHPTVSENAKNMNVEYVQHDFMKSKKISIPENTIMLFITGVAPTTGEIYPMNDIQKYVYLSDHDDTINNNVRQIRPLKVLDASQMIGKVKIDMIKDELNAVFFSCHKFGGEFNTGVLIIDDTNVPVKYKPLIAGTQQEHLRGGTYNAYAYRNINHLLNEYSSEYKPDECKEIYEKFIEELNKRGIEHYEPKLNHLYNTVLIKLHGCNAKAIHTLSDSGIYVGSSTACSHDNINKELRISYLNKSEFGKNTISKICDIIKNIDSDDSDDSSNESSHENGEIPEETSIVNKLNEQVKFEDEYI